MPNLVNMTSINTEKSDLFMSIIKKSFPHYFEHAQEYSNFFCANNLTEVLRNLENENYNYIKKINDFVSKRMTSSTSINFGFKDKKIKWAVVHIFLLFLLLT